MGLGILWSAVKILLLPLFLMFYILHRILHYISGGPYQKIHNVIVYIIATTWNKFVLPFLCWSYPCWNQVVRINIPWFMIIILPFLITLTKPPYWKYFEMDNRNVECNQLNIYPRNFMILSTLQIFSLWQWMFQLQGYFFQGFLPFQRLITNIKWLYDFLSPKLYRVLQKLNHRDSKNANACEKPQSSSNEVPPAKTCLQTNQESYSTDAVSFDSDTALVYLDTCATGSMSPFESDFVPGTFTINSEATGVEGSGGSLELQGYGTVRYTVHDDDGRSHIIEIPNTAYIPQLKYRLLAPQYIKTCEKNMGIFDSSTNNRTRLETDEDFSILYFNAGQNMVHVPHLQSARVPALPINQGTNVYTAFTTEVHKIFKPPDPTAYVFDTRMETSTTDEEWIHVRDGLNIEAQHQKVLDAVKNLPDKESAMESIMGVDFSKFSPEQLAEIFNTKTLNADQQELLAIHEKANHSISMRDIQALAAAGHLPKKLSLCSRPVCSSCLFGKAHRRPWRHKSKVKHIRKHPKTMKPGDCVSVDTFCSTVGGLIPQVTGFLTNEKFQAGTVFVDHASDFVFTHFQVDQTTDSAIEAKEAFERRMAQMGVVVRNYHADNGIFASRGFVNHVHNSNQHIEYCGVSAHFQNGIAENAIKINTGNARSMLLHAMYRWPAVITSNLWPFAVALADWNRNNLRKRSNGLTSLETIHDIHDHIGEKLKHSHPFGCPAFVLAAPLQDGNKIPKWDSRVRIGAYIGRSPRHAGNVAMILNPTTGHVSPQFHVVFDDSFSTIDALTNGYKPENWEVLYETNTEFVGAEAFKLAQEWQQAESKQVSELAWQMADDDANPISPPQASDDDGASEGDVPVDDGVEASEGDSSTSDVPQYNPIDFSKAGHRKSKRSTKPVRRLNLMTTLGFITTMCIAGATSAVVGAHSLVCNTITYQERVFSLGDATVNDTSPFAFSTTLADNDTLTLSQARKADDWPMFVEAMVKEMAGHESEDDPHWILTHVNDMILVDGRRPIPVNAVWAFKRKRDPLGNITKYKARLNVHGGQTKEGIHYWDTYAPVVQWLTVRIVLILSLLENLHSRSIDFILAFPQAKIKVDVYMRIPFGFQVPKDGQYVLKLRKNLYGLKDASATFWEKTRDTLVSKRYGFVQGNVDQCLFIRNDCILVTYVDDCLCFSRDPKVLDDIVSLLEKDFDMTDEGEVAQYLGVDVKRSSDGSTIELRQPYLIQRILEQLKITDANHKTTPSVKPLLHKDTDGSERKDSWNYRSVQGILNYLAGSTRPDIAFSTHQCARFCNDPKHLHETAMKRIGRYLLGTSDKGIILEPDRNKNVECFVDADFAGNWNKAEAEDAVNMLSRTGYVIRFMGCPILWVSKLQTEIALSTTEAEYIALSQAMRDVILLMTIIEELSDVFNLKREKPKIFCTVFEDNNGALELAKTPRMRPRTKHISLKYHHFRQQVKDGKVKIEAIDTKVQIADIFTKPLPRLQFETLRRIFLGW